MASTFGEEGHSANQNAGFQSHDNKKQEDAAFLSCEAMLISIHVWGFFFWLGVSQSLDFKELTE